MKNVLILLVLLLCSAQLSAQKTERFLNYLPIDTARQIILHAKTPEDKFYGYYSADRYYLNTGIFDSSEMVEKEMYSIAKKLNSDSLLCDANMSISNKYLSKQDYNYALIYVLQGADLAKDKPRKKRVTMNIAGVYAWSGNFQTGLEYLKKFDALEGDGRWSAIFRNMYYGMCYNGLGKPDSALYYLQKVEEGYQFRPDVNGYVQALGEFAKAYELKGDNDLADVYYKKALKFSKEKRAFVFTVIIGNKYCNFLLKQGNYADAGKIASENIITAKETGNFNGIASAAEVLQKVYSQSSNKDSAYEYAMIQIAYKDSASNQKKITEFQNLTFAQKLKDIDEDSKLKEAADQRKQNIQYALIALGIITLISLYLLLSRSFITNTKLIEFFGVVALLLVFEFLNLLLHPFLERVTHHSPILMLLALVCIAALLVPLHHKVEKWATAKLVEKNKTIRLAAAKKTIEKLEGDKNNT